MKIVFKKHLIAQVLAAVFCFFGIARGSTSESPWYSKSVESKNGSYIVTLESSESEFELNDYRQWYIVLQDKSTGEGVSPARFVVGGGMPMHGHGLPSQPQVTKHLGDGRYLIEGVRFNMLGQWVFDFEVTTQSGKDSVLFEVVVDY